MTDPKDAPEAGALGPAGAFVVRFRDGSRPAGPIAGRVEHVSSGRQSRFASLDEMIAFLLEMLPEPGGTRDRT